MVAASLSPGGSHSAFGASAAPTLEKRTRKEKAITIMITSGPAPQPELQTDILTYSHTVGLIHPLRGLILPGHAKPTAPRRRAPLRSGLRLNGPLSRACSCRVADPIVARESVSRSSSQDRRSDFSRFGATKDRRTDSGATNGL